MIGKTGLTLLVVAVLLGALSCRKEPTKTSRAPSGAPRQGQASQTPPTTVGGQPAAGQQPGTTAQQPEATAQQPPAGTKQTPGAGAGTEPNQAGTARGQTQPGQVTPTSAELSSQKTQPKK